MRFSNSWLVFFGCILLNACGTQPIKPSDKHIQIDSTATTTSADIPKPLTHAIPLPAPVATPKAETYSVVVANVPAQEILFALARDAKINLDIHPGIQGNVSINAINHTLPQILNRIAKQVDMRYEIENGNLIIMPDAPFLKHYKIDYVNMTRDSEGTVSDSTQGGAASAGNSSSLSIKNTSKNHFWETLTQNIKDILRETDKILPSGSSETISQQNTTTSTTGTGAQLANSKKQTTTKGGIENSPNAAILEGEGTTVIRTSTFREAASVISNPESGIITVRATGKQHEKIQEFIDQVMSSARRQVLIEATVVEVRLNDQYQQGIDWQRLRIGGSKGFALTQAGTQTGPTGLFAANTAKMFLLNYTNPTSNIGNLSANISLLESFGNVKVLSSPKLSVLNNQTAVIKVVDNLVYFTISGGSTSVTNGVTTTTPSTSAVNTVPVGFTMSITPQISDSDVVLFNIKPSISRLLRYVPDPVNTANQIPQMQTREMESILKVENNQIAVMGGLMQDEVNNLTDAIPGLSNLPLVGGLFKNRNDTTTKTELVIFLRPVVIKDASVNGDYSNFRDSLPDANFFKPAPDKNLGSK